MSRQGLSYRYEANLGSDRWTFAPITRPGRIDRVVYVGVADEQGRRDCAAHILSDWPDLIDKVVHEGEGETIAQFSDRCKTLAIKMYWRSQVDKPTDLK